MVGAALGLGCGGGEAEVLVGQVDSDAGTYVAVARQEGRLVAFFCNGDPTAEAYPGWFGGSVTENGSFHLERDGWIADGRFGESGVQGLLVEPSGDVSAWAASLPADPRAGLYASFHRGCTTGVIVLDPSPVAAPLVRGAWWCDDDHEPILQVTPLLPLTIVDDGRLLVEIDFASGTKQAEVEPLTDLPR